MTASRCHDLARRLLPWLAALAAGAVGMWLVHRFQFASGFDLFPGPRGDTRLTAYLVEHWFQVLKGNDEWLSPPMFYPVRGTLGYSDALLAFVPPYALLRACGLGIFTALAITVVVFDFLNYLVCWVLLYQVLRLHPAASIAGAMFFAFNNPKLAQADHLQLQALMLLPLLAICLVRSLRASRSGAAWRVFGWLALAALVFHLQLLTAYYVGWFLIFGSFLFLTLCFCFRRSRQYLFETVRGHPWAIAAAGIVWVVGSIPFLVIYLPAVGTVGWFPYRTALGYIPACKSFLLMADGNFVWSKMTEAIVRANGGDPDWGRRIGIGLVPSLGWLAITIAAWRTIRQRDGTVGAIHERQFLLALLVVAVDLHFLIGLQYHGHSLWHWVYRGFPGGRGIRAVARYAIVLSLPMAVAFAFLLHKVMQRFSAAGSRRARWLLTAGLAVVVAIGLFEQFNDEAGQYFSIRAEEAHLETLAAKLPSGCAAFYVVARPNRGSAPESFEDQQLTHDAMLVSLRRQVPTINGRSGNTPPGWQLGGVTAPEYEDRIRGWIGSHRIEGHVCRLEAAD